MLKAANPVAKPSIIRIGSQSCISYQAGRSACEYFLNRSTSGCYHTRFAMRVAWFSPVPPVRTGIAGRSAELIDALRQRGVSIDVYVESTSLRSHTAAASSHQGAPLQNLDAISAHDFVWRHRQQPYDLTVFQFGNSSHHDYLWPYALRY